MKNLKGINYVLFVVFAIAIIVSLVDMSENIADWVFIISLGVFAVEGVFVRGKKAVQVEYKDGQVIGNFIWAIIVLVVWVGMLAAMSRWICGNDAAVIGFIAMIVCIYNAINLTFFAKIS